MNMTRTRSSSAATVVTRAFGQTTRWDGDQFIVISAFWDAALQRQQLGVA